MKTTLSLTKTISDKRDKLRQLSAVESFAKKNYCSSGANAPSIGKLPPITPSHTPSHHPISDQNSSKDCTLKQESIHPESGIGKDNSHTASRNPSGRNRSDSSSTDPIEIMKTASVASETENIFKSVRNNILNSSENNESSKVEVDVKPLLNMIGLIDFAQAPGVPKFLMLDFDPEQEILEISWVDSFRHVSVDFYVLEYALDGEDTLEETRDTSFKISTENGCRV